MTSKCIMDQKCTIDILDDLTTLRNGGEYLRHVKIYKMKLENQNQHFTWL